MTVKDTPYQDAALSARQAQAIGIKTLQEWTTEAGEMGREGNWRWRTKEVLREIYEQGKDKPCLEYSISLVS